MNIFLPCWVATCSIFRRTNWLLYIEKCLGQQFSMLLYRKSGDNFSTSLKKNWFKLLILIFIFIFMHGFVGKLWLLNAWLLRSTKNSRRSWSVNTTICLLQNSIYIFFHKWQVIPHIILLQSSLDTKKMQLIDKTAR